MTSLYIVLYLFTSELNAAPRALQMDFDCKLTVLFFLEIEASFAIDVELPLNLDFKEELEIFGTTSSITVIATLDTENIENTELRVFNLDVANGFFTLEGSFINGVLSGTVKVPALQSEGSLFISADDRSAALNGTMSIFGGIIKPYINMILYWDLSYFYMSMGNIPLGGVVKLNDVVLEVDASEDFVLRFKSSLTCLFFVEIDTVSC